MCQEDFSDHFVRSPPDAAEGAQTMATQCRSGRPLPGRRTPWTSERPYSDFAARRQSSLLDARLRFPVSPKAPTVADRAEVALHPLSQSPVRLATETPGMAATSSPVQPM